MGQTVLLTGASSGIGAATASHLASRGFEVFGTSRRPRTPSPDERGVHWIAMDVCDEGSVEKGVAEVLERAGALDAVVCNAGFGIFGSVEEVSIDEAQRQFDTNFFGVLRTLRACLPGMRERGKGRAVLVGSLAGRAAIPFQAHYSATKAAVDNLSMALANEVRSHGIEVSLIEPGDINTPFNEGMRWGSWQGSPYAADLERCEAVIRESLPKAPGPEVVARAVERALTDPRPRTRYPVGPDSTLVPLARRLLSDRVCLRVIRSHFRLR